MPEGEPASLDYGWNLDVCAPHEPYPRVQNPSDLPVPADEQAFRAIRAKSPSQQGVARLAQVIK